MEGEGCKRTLPGGGTAECLYRCPGEQGSEMVEVPCRAHGDPGPQASTGKDDKGVFGFPIAGPQGTVQQRQTAKIQLETRWNARLRFLRSGK